MVGGTYVLVDDGPVEPWHYEYIASGPLTPTEYLPIGTIAEIREPSRTRAREHAAAQSAQRAGSAGQLIRMIGQPFRKMIELKPGRSPQGSAVTPTQIP